MVQSKIDAATNAVIDKLAEGASDERLCSLSKDKTLPKRMRELLGLRACSGYAEHGQYRELSDLSKDKEVPADVRKVAAESVEPAAMHVIEWGNPGALEKISKDTILPEKVRIAAGLKAVEKYVPGVSDSREYIGYKALVRMSEDAGLPESVREGAAVGIEAAAMNEIRWGVQRSWYARTIQMSKDECLPENVRKAASDAIGPAALKFIAGTRLHSGDARGLAENIDLPDSVRQVAALEEVGIIASETHFDEVGAYHHHLRPPYSADRLIEISKDDAKSGVVREIAGLKAVERYAEAGYPEKLIEMSKNKGLSGNVRIFAADAVEAAGMKAFQTMKRWDSPLYAGESFYRCGDAERMSHNPELPESVRKIAREYYEGEGRIYGGRRANLRESIGKSADLLMARVSNEAGRTMKAASEYFMDKALKEAKEVEEKHHFSPDAKAGQARGETGIDPLAWSPELFRLVQAIRKEGIKCNCEVLEQITNSSVVYLQNLKHAIPNELRVEAGIALIGALAKEAPSTSNRWSDGILEDTNDYIMHLAEHENAPKEVRKAAYLNIIGRGVPYLVLKIFRDEKMTAEVHDAAAAGIEDASMKLIQFILEDDPYRWHTSISFGCWPNSDSHIGILGRISHDERIPMKARKLAGLTSLDRHCATIKALWDREHSGYWKLHEKRLRGESENASNPEIVRQAFSEALIVLGKGRDACEKAGEADVQKKVKKMRSEIYGIVNKMKAACENPLARDGELLTGTLKPPQEQLIKVPPGKLTPAAEAALKKVNRVLKG